MNLPGTGMRIVKLLILETGSYNTQYRRPYNTHLTGQTMNAMIERLGGASTYDPSMMGGLANQFIAPEATPERPIAMINGWEQNRLMFMMEVEYSHYAGGYKTEIILGYTDHPGVGLNGSVDEQMEFYINSTIETRNTMELTPSGQQMHVGINDNSHIIVDNNWSGIYSPARDQNMRPVDVYVSMSRAHLAGLTPGDTLDARTMTSTMAVKSRRSNGLAADYMSNLLNGYSKACITLGEGAGNDQILDKARGNVNETLAARDPFLAAIAAVRGQPPGNVFTFRDLRMLDPNIENVTRAKLLGATEKATAHHTGQTADWGAANLETVTATILSQSVPGLLMKLGLTRVVFKATNREIGGAISILILDAQGFGSGNYSRSLEAFKIRLEHELLRDISYNNGIDFAIEMNVDLLNETWIKLSMDGNPFVDYVTPSFCDALLVPVITSNTNRALELAGDFENLAATLYETTEYASHTQGAGGYKPGTI